MQPTNEQLMAFVEDELEHQGKERFREDYVDGDVGVLSWMRGAVGARCRMAELELPTDRTIDTAVLRAWGIDREIDLDGRKVWLSDAVMLARQQVGPGNDAQERLYAVEGVISEEDNTLWQRWQTACHAFLAEHGRLFPEYDMLAADKRKLFRLVQAQIELWGGQFTHVGAAYAFADVSTIAGRCSITANCSGSIFGRFHEPERAVKAGVTMADSYNGKWMIFFGRVSADVAAMQFINALSGFIGEPKDWTLPPPPPPVFESKPLPPRDPNYVSPFSGTTKSSKTLASAIERVEAEDNARDCVCGHMHCNHNPRLPGDWDNEGPCQLGDCDCDEFRSIPVGVREGEIKS